MNLKEISLQDLMMDFDATSFYPYDVWDDIPIYPRRKTGFDFTPDMNNEIVEKCNNQTFTQGSAFLKVKNYNPPDPLFQNLPIKETVKKQDA